MREIRESRTPYERHPLIAFDPPFDESDGEPEVEPSAYLSEQEYKDGFEQAVVSFNFNENQWFKLEVDWNALYEKILAQDGTKDDKSYVYMIVTGHTLDGIRANWIDTDEKNSLRLLTGSPYSYE